MGFELRSGCMVTFSLLHCRPMNSPAPDQIPTNGPWSAPTSQGFPGGASGKEPACQCRRHKRHRFDPLEEGLAIHSSILARRIPWTEEPGRLQSMESQRAGHNYSDLAHTAPTWEWSGSDRGDTVEQFRTWTLDSNHSSTTGLAVR